MTHERREMTECLRSRCLSTAIEQRRKLRTTRVLGQSAIAVIIVVCAFREILRYEEADLDYTSQTSHHEDVSEHRMNLENF